MPKSTPSAPVTRRSFTLGAAAVTTAALLPPAATQSQSAAPSHLEMAAMAKLSPAARAEVEMKAGEIFRKYGSRLSDEQKADIRKVMAETQDGLEKMRSFVLANGDQPATVFKFFEGEKKQSHA